MVSRRPRWRQDFARAALLVGVLAGCDILPSDQPPSEAELSGIEAFDPSKPEQFDEPCVTVQGNLDLRKTTWKAEWDNVCEVTGKLTINGATQEDVWKLRRLKTVGGRVEILNQPLTSLAGLRALQTVGPELTVHHSSGELFKDAFVSLTTVNGWVRWQTISGLSTLRLAKLQKAEGFDVSSASQLESIALPALTEVKSVYVTQCPQVNSVTLDALKSVDELILCHSKLTTAEVDALAKQIGAKTHKDCN